ncbi:MAG: Holliday junction DNA helicase RuvA [Candidatus Portnoybacteria bacterium RBG_13_41_18]|uniref:Holliday junction branch migration complex subunit RuvA n=1 Tax=Candidatus Portnoybacteria bacterium RBG_13_41_18 TaxID=1801991 RepID=A0A1G2F8V8_9BACT|nr:MAG: Holliday junction DNA helicase RuvA [Candidatus Portnoybacteria bacterium RBG_13_41_18]
MISSLEGKILLKSEKYFILETNGIGYKVFGSEKTLSKIPQTGQNIKVWTYLSVKENGWDLFGFLNFEELDLFALLITIPGIGPKTAMNILGVASVADLQEAIVLGDETILGKVSGIGKKMAQKIVLELKSKVKKLSKGEASGVAGDIEVIDALVSLGYRIYEVREILQKLPAEVKGVENRVKECLKRLGSTKK